MPGTLKIQVNVGCDGSPATMTLSGSAEPNGGGYTCTINWYEIAQGLYGVEYEVSPGSWIAAPSSFHFSHANEHYKLRARGAEALLEIGGVINFPYIMTADYAPPWATKEGKCVGVPIDEECCEIPPGYEYVSGNAGIIGGNYASGGYATTPDCMTLTYVSPFVLYGACCLTDYNSGPFSYTPPYYFNIYDWLDKEFSVSGSLSQNTSAGGISGNNSVTVNISKVSGEGHCTVVFQTHSQASGTFDETPGALPAYDYPDGITSDISIPCSDYVFRISTAGDLNVAMWGVLSNNNCGLSLVYAGP